MKNTALILSLLSISAASWAQPVPPAAQDNERRQGPGREQMEKKREQMKQRFDEQFKKADADGDGALSKAEAEKSMPRLARDFDAIDANKDGKVTQDEIRKHMESRMAERRGHHGGRGGPEGGPGGKGGPGGPQVDGKRERPGPEQMAKRREEMQKHFDDQFKKADADGDGALSKAEAEKSMPRLARDFDAIDANKDGKVTQDEIRKHMESRMADRRGGRGPGGPQGGPGGDAKPR